MAEGQSASGTGSASSQNVVGPKRAYVRPETMVTEPGVTEKGFTKEQARAILAREKNIRKNKDESAHVFDDDGNEVYVEYGHGASVRFRHPERLKDRVVTHNHPLNLGKSGTAAIGNSLSPADVRTSVFNDAKEIRAVTENYTFSLKRPKNGWGLKNTSKEVEAVLSIERAWADAARKTMDYVSKHGYSQESVSRAEVVFHHQFMKRVAQENGWIYSKKRG